MSILKPAPKPIRTKREYKRPAVKETVPLEDTEQMTVVAWLRAHKVLFSSTVPDRKTCQRMGYSPGVPDILIYDRPRMVENGTVFVGCAIELKRREKGIVSAEQKQWLIDLHERGWASYCIKGCDAAIRLLEFLYLGKGSNPCPNDEILQAKDLER